VTGYAGRLVSGNYINAMFLKTERPKRAHYDLSVQRRDATVLKVDASFKVTKHLAQVNGVKTFEGLQTGLNEYEEIRIQHFIQSTAHS
jgi:hypothetical protein